MTMPAVRAAPAVGNAEPVPLLQVEHLAKIYELRTSLFQHRDLVAVDSEAVERATDLQPATGLADTPESALLHETLAPELQAAIDALPF